MRHTSDTMAIIPIEDILRVELLRNVFVFGFKVIYKVEIGEKELVIRSLKYVQWGRDFQSLGIDVIQPNGWLG